MTTQFSPDAIAEIRDAGCWDVFSKRFASTEELSND